MADFNNPFPSRIDGAVRKFNASNEQRIIAATNLFAEFDNDYKLLQEYSAYKTPDFKDAEFTRISSDTISTAYKGKPVEIKLSTQNNGNELREINFKDGSQISYVTFSDGEKMGINGEEFEMPAGTVLETRSVQGKVFSRLIQTPDMLGKIVNMPEELNDIEQRIIEHKQTPSKAVMPKVEFMMKLLGYADSARALLHLSNKKITSADEINFLKKNISEGRLPENTAITGVRPDGVKILTIPGENCKYEVCGSEMRVIDDNGEIKMIARYEGAGESNGLWVVSYDNEKPISGFHYNFVSTDKPLSTVTYTYNNDNTVTSTTIYSNGNKISTKKIPPEGYYLAIEKELKFVPQNKPHLGLVFENQTPFRLE